MKPYNTGETPEVGDVVRIVDWSSDWSVSGERLRGKDWTVTALDAGSLILGGKIGLPWSAARFALVRRGAAVEAQHCWICPKCIDAFPLSERAAHEKECAVAPPAPTHETHETHETHVAPGPPVYRPAAAEQAALLDHFAGLAIQGVSLQRLIDPSLAPIPVDALAHRAYDLAAAMLAERARRVTHTGTETP